MKKQFILGIVFSIVFLGFGFSNSAAAENVPAATLMVPYFKVSLEGDLGNVVTKTATTDDKGQFTFANLTAGNYKLTVQGQPPKSITVGTDGTISGNVVRDDSGKPTVNVTVFLNMNVTSRITPADLGITDVGTLPDSSFYFLKEWGWGFKRFFTFDPIAKAELELKITNVKAAELLEVEKAYDACVANALGGDKTCKPGDKVGAIKKALENYTNAQERLITQVAKPTHNPTDARVVELLKNIDEKTALHVALLEQLSQKILINDPYYADHSLVIKEALNNTLKTFTITVTAVNDVPALKKKAAEEITKATEAIKKAETTTGVPFEGPFSIAITGPDSITWTIVVVVNMTAPTGSGGSADRWVMPDDWPLLFGGPTANPKSLSMTVVDGTGFSVGQLVRIENELVIITAINGNNINFTHSTVTSVGVPIPFVNVTLRTTGTVSIPTDQRDFTTSTASDGSYKFTGLAPGKYDIFIAGQMVKSLTVGNEGTIIGRTLVVYSDNHGESIAFVPGRNPAGIAMDIYTPGGVLIPSLKATGKNTGGTNIYDTVTNIPESPYIPALVAGGGYRFWTAIPSYIAAIVNAKGNLESAKELLAEGRNGEAYGQARSVEAMVTGIGTILNDDATIVPIVNGDTTPENDETLKIQTKTENDTSPEPDETVSAEQKVAPKSETVTTMTSSLNPSTSNRSVTFTATVTGGVTPTGSVTFSLGVATLGVGTLNDSGVATFTTASLANATHIITATYSGDETHSSSISSPFNQVVNVIPKSKRDAKPSSGGSKSGDTESSSGGSTSTGSGSSL